MKRILFAAMLILTAISCNQLEKTTHKTTNKPGYCYMDEDGMWYVYYLNEITNRYEYVGTPALNTFAYDFNTVSWTPTPQTVSNFNEVPSEISESMAESAGESVSVNDVGTTTETEGMSESTGESGDSDGGSSGGDSSGDSGGGGDGGGGE